MDYVDYVYNIIFLDTLDMDAIYKDFILREVGTYGFNALYENRLLESCGVVNGRQLFVLCSRENKLKEIDRDVRKKT